MFHCIPCRTAAYALIALTAVPALANGPMGGTAPTLPSTSSAASTPSTGGTIDITPPTDLTGPRAGGIPLLGMPPIGQPKPVGGPTSFMGPAPYRPTTFMGPDDGSAARRGQAWIEMNNTIDVIRHGGVGTALTAIVTQDPNAIQAAAGADSLLMAGGGLAWAGAHRPDVRPVPTNPAPLRAPAEVDSTTVLDATVTALRAQRAGAPRGSKAAALRTDVDNTFTDVSSRAARAMGEPPTPHAPEVTEALKNVPMDVRKPWHGKCAETGCFSQALTAGQDPRGGMSTAVDTHTLNPVAPCPSCQHMADEMGVRYYPKPH